MDHDELVRWVGLLAGIVASQAKMVGALLVGEEVPDWKIDQSAAACDQMAVIARDIADRCAP